MILTDHPVRFQLEGKHWGSLVPNWFCRMKRPETGLVQASGTPSTWFQTLAEFNDQEPRA